LVSRIPPLFPVFIAIQRLCLLAILSVHVQVSDCPTNQYCHQIDLRLSSVIQT
jgi:hypothetical protein